MSYLSAAHGSQQAETLSAALDSASVSKFILASLYPAYSNLEWSDMHFTSDELRGQRW